MKTSINCIPCFFQQAIDAASAAGANEADKKRIVDVICHELQHFKLEMTPPEMGRIIYGTVKKITGNADAFYHIKRASNKLALSLYTDLKKTIAHSPERLLKAVELAIIGNSIDYGAQRSFDVEKEIRKILNKEFDTENPDLKKHFDYRGFHAQLTKAKKILYLGDNAGEIVFDRLLIEEIKHIYGADTKSLTYVVRGGSIINDILMEDAHECGLLECANVISSGCDAPGVVIGRCSDEFMRCFKDADLIISKGQGNFEALPTNDNRIWYLFRVKCPVVSKHLDCGIGSYILKA